MEWELADSTTDLADKDIYPILEEPYLELTDDPWHKGLELGEYDLRDYDLLDMDTDLNDKLLNKDWGWSDISRNSESCTQSLGLSSVTFSFNWWVVGYFKNTLIMIPFKKPVTTESSITSSMHYPRNFMFLLVPTNLLLHHSSICYQLFL